MQTLIMIGQLLLGLSILVAIHEFGHFIFARLFKMRVDKFFIFFDFWGKKLFSVKKGHTEYGLGWFPLGGYVKISGMIDESMDKEQMAKEPQPWEFRSKPAWQRLIVMVAGVFMNLVLGIFIFSMMAFYYGEKFVSIDKNDPAIVAMKLGKEIGFETGDTLYKINNIPYSDLKEFKDIFSYELLLAKNARVEVIRNGKIEEIIIPENLINRIVDEGIEDFILQAFSFSVARVIPKSNADKAGLRDNDIIIAVDSTPVLYYHQFVEILRQEAEKTVDIQVLRNNDTVLLQNVQVTKEGTIGFQVQDGLIVDIEKYPFFTSFIVGNKKAWFSLKENTLGFVKVIRGDVDPRKALHGPISIAKRIYGGVWIWEKFWYITGLLSLILAFMNILPIPALDGGHVITIFIEMITGRPLRTKVLEIIQTIGLIIIFGLMILIVFNDIIQNFF